MTSTFSPNKNYELQATGDNSGTWGTKANANLSIIDLNLGGVKNATLSGFDVTVSTADAENITHILSGALSANINYKFPNAGSIFNVVNNTTGPYTVTLKNAGGGAGLDLPQGQSALVFVNSNSTTIQYVSLPGFYRNWLINGDMEIWQRGAGGSASIAVGASSTAYTADRWFLQTQINEACTVSQQASISDGSRYCARIQRNLNQTGTASVYFGQPLDSDVIHALRGKIVTISAKVRTGASWSPSGGTLVFELLTGTGTNPAKRGASAYTGEATVAQVSTTLSTSSAVTVVSATSSSAFPTNATQAEVHFTWQPFGSAGVADYVEIDEVMLCAATGQTTFDRKTFIEDLRECLHFYQKTFPYSTAPAQNTGIAQWVFIEATAANTADSSVTFPFPGGEMRSAPAFTGFNPKAANAQAWDFVASAAVSSTSLGNSGSGKGWTVTWVNASGGAAGHLLGIDITADAEI